MSELPTYFTGEHAIAMTLRDYFASKAMQGLLASDVTDSLEKFVKKAYEIADAMLKERNK